MEFHEFAQAPGMLAEAASSGATTTPARSRPRVPHLSKTRYLAGRQCPKRLWLLCHEPDKAMPPTPAVQFLFEQGRQVARHARRLFPGGVAVAVMPPRVGPAIAKTRELIERAVPVLFEAAFSHANVVVRADVLRRTGRQRWQLTEIKSSTRIKPEHVPDLAVQYWVISACGLEIERCSLLHVNNKFVYGDPTEKFFRERDVTQRVQHFVGILERELVEFRHVLRLVDAPDIDMGPFCRVPHLCEFFAHCRACSPPDPIMELPRIGRRYVELMRLGVRRIPDIPEDFELTRLQRRVYEAVRDRREYIGPLLGAKLRRVEYPVHYLDMETVGTAFPLYAGTRPYQAIPFQYSVHTRAAPGAPARHRQYLHRAPDNPMPTLASRLLADLGRSGTVCAYTGYEQRQIETLAAAVPEHAEPLRALIPRLLDLAEIVRSDYYHPGFGGSFSLKAVAPALLADLDFRRLEIQSGARASVEYLKLIDAETADDLRDRIAANLESYCHCDTLALMRVHHALLEKTEPPPEDSNGRRG